MAQARLASLFTSQKLATLTHPLSEVADALKHVGAGHTVGR
jgi:hypothetical protein